MNITHAMTAHKHSHSHPIFDYPTGHLSACHS